MAFLSNLLKTIRERREAAQNCDVFRTALLAAVADGRLTHDEIRDLDDLRFKLHLSERDLATLAQQAYATAFEAGTAHGVLTEAEEEELRQIQMYLLVPDQEIAANKQELERLRLIREIGEGKLPTTNAPGLVLQQGETAYWREPASLLEHRTVGREYVGGSHGISLRIAKGLSYRVGSYRGHLIS